jgi:hypothetical protein
MDGSKKKAGVFIICFLTLSLVIAGRFDIADAGENISQALDNVLNILAPFFEKIIGEYSSSEFFFSKILLLIFLIIIIRSALTKVPIGDNNNIVKLILSILISILSIRFINQNGLFEALFLQYGAVGIGVTTIFLMTIVFYTIHKMKLGTYGRKVSWAIFIIILTGLWISISSDIPTAANFIYGFSILTSILMIPFDKQIHSYLGVSHLHIFMKKANREAILRAKERILKLNERLDTGIIDDREYRRALKEEEDRIKEWSKE